MDGTQIDQDMITTPRGLLFPRDMDVLKPRIAGNLRRGLYENKEGDAVLRIVQPDDVVLELGGGLGFISTLIAKRSEAAHVHVYEANGALADYIKRVHAANGIENATVHHAMLGKRKATKDFHVRGNILASSTDETNGDGIIRTEPVDVVNAGQQTKAIKPTVLVCDIEGGEAELLPEMDLNTVRAAVIELHPQWIGPEGVNAVFGAMMGAGLAYYPKLSTQKVVTFRRAWPLR
ncbi:FkbM family methyltransferase [uncultured Tateyamaria sp.]|uniref:FkbM family methyltransferase n=1 Tax=uncultured Tateyamaria sp. TaxID=455651 RepID=UPI00262DB93E|nr:FkbM family methyltransferase [uncultured Tateyamaria sp.]